MERVSIDETVAFLEHAFRNIELPPLTPSDIADIRDGLAQFAALRARATLPEGEER